MSGAARFWTALKWACLVATLVLVAALILSRWFIVSISFVAFFVDVGNGTLRVVWTFLDRSIDGAAAVGFKRAPGDAEFRWTFDWMLSRPMKVIEVPLWFLTLIPGAAAVLLIRRERRAAQRLRAGLCVSCQYDRTGLPAGARCPECGGA